MDPAEAILRADSVDDVDENLWPDATHALASKWENNEIVRKIYRHKKSKRILLWPEKKQNITTMATLAPNRQAVFDTLEIWAPCVDEPKSPPVSWLKSEVWYCQTKS